MTLSPLFYLVVGHILALVAATAQPRRCSYCGVQSLSLEPDYRAIKLSWKYVQAQEPPAFRVKYCEVSAWQSKVRCRQRVLPMSRAVHPKGKWGQKELPPDQLLGKLIRLEKGSYQTSITDLRMITNYTFTVDADYAGYPYNLASGSRPYSPTSSEQFPVSAETKGFSGKTLRCLGNASEVAVHTGPYFNGKISVEGASDESCSLYGNHSSSLQIYTMSINHLLCGSKLVNNNSSVETMIIVHENREILTHNSRRFLVVCNFPNETFTFTASVDVPSHLLKRKKAQHETESLPKDRPSHRSPPQPATATDENNNIYEKYKFNHVRDSRILANAQSAHTSHRVFQRSVTDAPYDLLDVGAAAAAFLTGAGLLYFVGKQRNSGLSSSSTRKSLVVV